MGDGKQLMHTSFNKFTLLYLVFLYLVFYILRKLAALVCFKRVYYVEFSNILLPINYFLKIFLSSKIDLLKSYIYLKKLHFPEFIVTIKI